MGRAKELLSHKERILYETHLHWVLFLEAASYIFIAIGISFLGYKWGGQYEKLFHYCSLPFWGYGGVKFLMEWVQHTSADFIVTNNRVIIKVGVLKRSSLSMPLSKIESIEIDQTLVGQIFGFGNIHITGTGTATSKFEYLTAPGAFRQKIQHATNMLDTDTLGEHDNDGSIVEQEYQHEPKPKPKPLHKKRLRRR